MRTRRQSSYLTHGLQAQAKRIREVERDNLHAELAKEIRRTKYDATKYGRDGWALELVAARVADVLGQHDPGFPRIAWMDLAGFPIPGAQP